MISGIACLLVVASFLLPFLLVPEFGAGIKAALDQNRAGHQSAAQLGYAGDINIRVQSGHARVKLDASMRSLEFMLTFRTPVRLGEALARPLHKMSDQPAQQLIVGAAKKRQHGKPVASE